ncbi:hypothetical protein BDV29DRAFT_161026 [Aspergillus leporis]|uniref:HMG box domain-containing protein n=1 Tax=Aspergillus leporis TaxID=41062 RepID=A0A5N5WMS8_9EURO|nr:hypothetical protein BDV29DRAFT_161026 [Aspergillus leporis]
MGSISSNPPAKNLTGGRPKGSKNAKGRSIRKVSTLQDRHETQLSAPLSELAKDTTHVTIRETENWVHRSTETRRQEVTQRLRKIPRPMNSFLLYRKAYSGLAKEFLAQSHHCMLSIVIGKSWRMESQEIRYRFADLADIERKNHMEAHPSYKYSPKPRYLRENSRRDNKSLCIIDTSSATAQSRQETAASKVGNVWDSYSCQEALDRPTPGLIFSPDWTQCPQGFTYPSIRCSWENFLSDGVEMLDSVQPRYSLVGLPGALHLDLLEPQKPVSTPRAAATGWFEGQLLEMQDHPLSRTVGESPNYDPYHCIGQDAQIDRSYDPAASHDTVVG